MVKGKTTSHVRGERPPLSQNAQPLGERPPRHILNHLMIEIMYALEPNSTTKSTCEALRPLASEIGRVASSKMSYLEDSRAPGDLYRAFAVDVFALSGTYSAVGLLNLLVAHG